MNPTFTVQFERFAQCCLELAQRAETPASRARLIQMAREYEQSARRPVVIENELQPVPESS
jgi:hypothetical protein